MSVIRDAGHFALEFNRTSAAVFAAEADSASSVMAAVV
jgi:hypothetical protein